MYSIEIQVGKVQEVYLCASEDFKEIRESKIALDAYKKRESYQAESALDFLGME